MNLLIKHAAILTNSEPHVIESGYVAVKGNRIFQVSDKPIEGFLADTVIDGTGKLCMPGLVNAHSHVPMTLMRGYADDLELFEWLNQHIFPVEDRLDDETVLAGSLLGIGEMIRSGTTCFCDSYFFCDAIAEAVKTSGIRADIARSTVFFGETYDPDKDERFCEAREIIKKYNNTENGRLTVSLAPHAIYSTTPDNLKFIAGYAKEHGLKINLHTAETKKEYDDCMQQYGMTPVEYIESCGIFENKTLCAHGVHLTGKDFEILKQYGASVVHNPTSNLKLASGFCEVQALLDRGVNVALGTDGAASNNNLNMFEEMHLLSLLPKALHYDPKAVTADTAVKIATVNGAKALGIESGVIAEGFLADLILVDLSGLHFQPMHHIVSAVCYSAQGNDVDTVIVDGNIVMKNKELLTLDEEMIKYKVKEAVNKLFH